MQQNSRPIIILLILLAVALFLIGFRFGKTIEHIDKTYAPPIRTTTPIPTISPQSPTFKTFHHQVCATSFLYPSTMTQETISSEESVLKDAKNNIAVSCNEKEVKMKLFQLKEVTASEKITAAAQTIAIFYVGNIYEWSAHNPINGRRVFFQVTADMKDLIMNTFRFAK